MPCYEPRRESEPRGDSNHVDPTPFYKRISHLEAILCAVFNELRQRKIIGEVICDAEINGGVDIKTFWQQHQKEDEDRLAKDLVNFLEKFSDHEQTIIVDLLAKRKK